MERLDEKIVSGVFSWRTANRVWGLVTKLFADSADSKVAALRVRSDNPAQGVRGPDRGEAKAKQWLYPREVAALLACPEVPLRWRRLYALATYLYLRPGELAGLDWKRVHLSESYVDVAVSMDLRTGKVKDCPKTKHRRKVPIHPALVPLVEALKTETSGTGLVVQHDHENKDAEHGFPPLEDLASTLRTHLKRAGVTRSDLHEDGRTTKRLTFYDLRATGITWEILAGTEHTRVMQRAGHERFETTLGYIREADTLGENVGTPFPPLPSALVSGTAEDPPPSNRGLGHQGGPSPCKPSRSEKKVSVPNGIRTRVAALKGPCPGPS